MQVLQLQVSGGDAVTVRATPLESTSIKTGGRRRDPSSIKMAKRTVTAAKLRHKKKEADKRRKTSSLFRKLSNKRASAEMAGKRRFEILNYEWNDCYGVSVTTITPVFARGYRIRVKGLPKARI